MFVDLGFTSVNNYMRSETFLIIQGQMGLSKSFPLFLIVCLFTLLALKNVDACSCYYTHPQTHFCSADFVLVVKVKERIPLEHETIYKVKINRKFKLSNDSLNEHLYSGQMYTANMDSVCGVQLDIGETYVVSGRVFEGKPRLSLCNLVMRWATVTKRQRKGFKGLYAKGCVCDVTFTTFKRKGAALHQANGRLCPWEGNPGPTDCQEQHGICVYNQGRCFWMPSRPYDQCIREHHLRLVHQRPRELP